MKLSSASLTDVGKARDINEDSMYEGRRIFAIADGLGGHRAGEVASGIAIAAIEELEDGADNDAAEALVEAVRKANREVFERAHHEQDLKGMATTVTALAVDGTRAHLAHVGDSRCYLLRDGAISQLSQDHTLVARLVTEGKLTQRQAETHPQRSVVTRALGAGPDVEVDTLEIELYGGDRVLLCSDGLTATLADDEIRELATKRTELGAICKALVDEANARGGPDNISVVIVAVEGPRHRVEAPPVETPAQAPAGLARTPRAEPDRSRRVPVRALVWIGVVIIALLAAFIGVRSWVNGSWYVGVDGTQVAIFRGLPTDALGNRLHHVEQSTPVALSDVAPFYRPRLQEGIRVDNLRAAQALVNAIPKASPSPSPKPSPKPSGSPHA